MPAQLQDRPVLDDAVRRSLPRRRFPVRLVVAGAVVAGAAVGINAVGDWIAGWGNPTEPRVIDRSPAPLLLALDDLSEYHAATATVRVDIDREIDTPWVPSIISGERVTFQATGTADAYVDFENLDADAVTLSADGNSASIVLPAPEIAQVRLDPENTRVVDRDRGLLQRVDAALADNPTDDSELYALAERRLAGVAGEERRPGARRDQHPGGC